jgi:hypothetical protein
VITLRAALALGIALATQAALGRFWPDAHRYLDVMVVPVVWYGIAHSQRRAMLVGCAAGLLQDAWFQVGSFGLNGFKKTLLGWALGGMGSWIDLNQPMGRLLAGTMVSLGDSLLDLVLRRMLDQQPRLPAVLELLATAIASGLLVVLSGYVVERVHGGRAVRQPV